jgi:PAS domain S-box-containing protein
MKNLEWDSSLTLLQNILESIPIWVFWKDQDSRFLGCNTLFAKNAGLTRPEELIGKTDFEMVWADQAELYRADDKIVMDSDLPKLGYEELQTTPNGRKIWVRTSKVPLHGADGKAIGLFGICEDITKRKQAEFNLAEQLEELRRWHDITLGREGRVLELKHEVNELLGQAGQPPRYLSAESQDPKDE